MQHRAEFIRDCTGCIYRAFVDEYERRGVFWMIGLDMMKDQAREGWLCEYEEDWGLKLTKKEISDLVVEAFERFDGRYDYCRHEAEISKAQEDCIFSESFL